MTKNTTSANIAALPFVRRRKPSKKNPSRRCFWAVRGTGDYVLDCELGRVLAGHAITYMANERFPLLALIVSDMVERGKFGGVEVGFLEQFSLATMRDFIGGQDDNRHNL